MKIVHLNCVYGSASTGRMILEMTDAMTAAGHDVHTFFSEGAGYSAYSERYISDFSRNLHAILSRLTGLQGYFSLVPTLRLLRKIDARTPDVVHLHVLHGNGICLPLLFSYLKRRRIPVVATLHDCWLFTGKCSHPGPYGCRGYTSDCARCPAKRDVNPSWLFVPARKMHADRKRWFQGLTDYRIVGVSDWVSGLAKESFLADDRVQAVYNWIDARVFHPGVGTEELRRSLRLEGKRVILGVCSVWSDHKGLNDFLALAKRIPDDQRIVLAGRMPQGVSLPDNVIAAGSIDSPAKLAAYYALADVYVNASLFETFGLTSAEALMCGTPVAAYGNTATKEIVPAGCGALVPPQDGVEGLLCAVDRIIRVGKAAYSRVCAAHALEHFDMRKNIEQILRVYRNVVAASAKPEGK